MRAHTDPLPLFVNMWQANSVIERMVELALSLDVSLISCKLVNKMNVTVWHALHDFIDLSFFLIVRRQSFELIVMFEI